MCVQPLCVRQAVAVQIQQVFTKCLLGGNEFRIVVFQVDSFDHPNSGKFGDDARKLR